MEKKKMIDTQNFKPYDMKVDQKNDQNQLFVYACKICRIILAKTERPMDQEGIQEKLRKHHCTNPSKQDFELELR